MRGINQLYQKHSRYLFISAWILWALFLLLLHRQAFMHSDDFGYASLSYGWEGNSHGMAWNIGDLFAFLKWHYLNWGGRILYFGLLTPLLHAGEPVIQVFQAFVFFGVTYMAYTLIKREKTDLPAALAVMAAFGTIGRETVTDGVLWYTAAAVYIWPMLPLYGAIAWMKKDSRRSGWKTTGLCLLMFASGFSHEQIAAMLLIYCVARLIQEGTEKKRIRASVLLPLLCGIAGALLEILAPGNFARAGTIPEF